MSVCVYIYIRKEEGSPPPPPPRSEARRSTDARSLIRFQVRTRRRKVVDFMPGVRQSSRSSPGPEAASVARSRSASWKTASTSSSPDAVATTSRRPLSLGGRFPGTPTSCRPRRPQTRRGVAVVRGATTDAFGRLDLLGDAQQRWPLRLCATFSEEVTYDDWCAAIDLQHHWRSSICTQACARSRVAKNQQPMGGRIINNGSIAAHSPRPDAVAYTASQHAMTGLTKQTSLDGRKYDIACGQIDIGNAAVRPSGDFGGQDGRRAGRRSNSLYGEFSPSA